MENLGYVHGSDLLLGIMVDEVFTPLGHSKTCTITNAAETKDRAVKPTLADKASAAMPGLWKDKSVSGLSVSLSAEGFVFHGDELGYDKLLALWEAGKPVVVKYAMRGEEGKKYRQGNFVITSLEEQAPGDDDATYSISMENCGVVEVKTVTP